MKAWVKTEELGIIYDFEGPLDGLEGRIRKHFEKVINNSGFENLELKEYGYGDNSSCYILKGTRPMTVKEIVAEARKTKDALSREKARGVRDYETYLKLKKKFGVKEKKG